MSQTIGQPIIEGVIPIDITPYRVGLPPPTRRATGSSPSTFHTIRQPPTVRSTPLIPPGFVPPASHTPPPASHTPPPASHTPPPASHTPPPASHTPPPASPTDSHPEALELNRTSVPEDFGQKQDPPTYLTSRFQHDVATLSVKFQAIEKKMEAYSARSEAELAGSTAALLETLGSMILESERRQREAIDELKAFSSLNFQLLFDAVNHMDNENPGVAAAENA